MAETPVPALSGKNVLVGVQHSLISTGTEIAAVSRSRESLIQKVVKNPKNITKVIDLFKSEGLQKTALKIKAKQIAESVSGYSCAGRVLELGTDVRDLSVGDRVACAGAGFANHAECVSVPRNLVTRIPDDCSSVEASSVTLGAIALQGVRRADIRLGETVAVIGLGLIGQITAQLVRASGCRVVGVDIDQDRIEKALEIGMDYGLNPLNEDVAERIKHITGRAGTDTTIITAESKESLIIQQAMEITRKKGRVVIVGAIGLDVQRKPFYEKEIDLLISCSYGPGRYDKSYELDGIDYPLPYVRWTENRNMGAYLDLLAAGRISFLPLIEGTYPLEDAASAFGALSREGKKPLAVILEYRGEKEQENLEDDKILRISEADVASEKINVGLIGTGSFAVGMHLPNLKSLDDKFRIRALAGRDGARLKGTGRQFDVDYVTTEYQKILADDQIDAVLICTRHNLHARLIEAAIDAEKAVFVEKPLATTSSDMERLTKRIANAGNRGKIMVGFNRRFSPAAVRVSETVRNRVNPLMLVYRVNAGYIPLDHWVHTEEGGGRIVGEACHMLDLFRYLVGQAPVSVDVSHISPTTPHLSKRDNFIASIKYADGSVASLVYTALGANKLWKERIDVFCDNSVMTIDDYKSLTIKGAVDRDWTSRVADKGHVAELNAFEAYLKGRSGPPIPWDELVETTELSLAIDALVVKGAEVE